MIRVIMLIIGLGFCFFSSAATAQEKKVGTIGLTIDNSFFLTEYKKDGFHARGQPHTSFNVRRREGRSERVDTNSDGLLPIDFRRHGNPREESGRTQVALWIDY